MTGDNNNSRPPSAFRQRDVTGTIVIVPSAGATTAGGAAQNSESAETNEWDRI
jgi:hypothetical protein